MNNFSKNKEDMLAIVRSEEEKLLTEQDKYYALIEQFADGDPEVIHARIEELGWEGIKKALRNESYPPDDEERQKHLYISYSDGIACKKLKIIEDLQLRGSLTVFNDMHEHTQRIRAMAKFMELLGGATIASNLIMKQWLKILVLQRLHQEAVILELSDKAASLQQLIDSYDKKGQIYADNVREMDSKQSNRTDEERQKSLQRAKQLIEKIKTYAPE